MKVLIEMSPDEYELLVAECAITSPEYSLLKNAVIARDGNGDNRGVVQILCDKDDATGLLETANRLYPPAATPIAKAIEQAWQP